MLELGSSGSMRGVSSNGHPYRDAGPLGDLRLAPGRKGKGCRLRPVTSCA